MVSRFKPLVSGPNKSLCGRKRRSQPEAEAMIASGLEASSMSSALSQLARGHSWEQVRGRERSEKWAAGDRGGNESQQAIPTS